MSTELYIKYMVSLRCKMMVKEVFKNLGIPYTNVDLGVVEVPAPVSAVQHEYLKKELHRIGLVLLDDKKSILIEKIKNVIIDLIRSDRLPKVNYSEYISEKVGYDYSYVANIFSEIKGMTIQQFIIFHKIERVKELLLYDQLSLTEISNQLHYSSVAHLSNQFKRITGLTPSFFKQLKENRRRNIEDL
ncbi:helix-turn-helix domain-containing protein [Pleomorphovibrio marinus]|uniref:helix-turn-helix domain-containing protein n=1 Tax=Pleomorphovibrio marinus TaxID=2164132 RepID=UPI001E5DE67E|nr:AraC family transcriptional regulator [Pleomorphovibrio marinus]